MDNHTFSRIPSSLSDADDQIEKKWKNFTDKTIDILQPLIPDVDLPDIPGWGGPDDGDGQPSANFAVFMMSLIFAIFWITYITFFNSRVFGSILTRLANSKFLQRFIGDTGGYIKVRKCHVLLQTFFCLCLIFVFLKIWLDVEWMVAGRFHLRGWLHKTICWPAPS